MTRWTFTSESVTEGHPDKMADQISDSDPRRHPRPGPDGPGRLRDDGHHRPRHRRRRDHHHRPTSRSPRSSARRSTASATTTRDVGFDGNTCGVITSIDPQSPDIAQGVDTAFETRTGVLRRGRPQQPGRRRPGDDVRLRLQRDRRPHAAADLAGPPPGRAPGRGPQVRASSRTCAPTARPRSPSTTRATSPSSSRPCSSPPSTSPGIDAETHDQARPDRARHPPVAARAVRRRRLPGAASTRPATSSSAAPTPTAASPAARSSSTPTAAWPATVAAPSPARTRPRSTARPPTPPAGSPRTSSPPAPPSAARSRWPTPSASPSRCRSSSRPSAPSRSTEAKIVAGRARRLRPAPGRHPPRPRPAPADLPEDRGLRALRSRRPGLHLGADHPGRRPQVRPRPLIVAPTRRAVGPPSGASERGERLAGRRVA